MSTKLTPVQAAFLDHLREHPKGIVPFWSGHRQRFDYFFNQPNTLILTRRTVVALEDKGLIDVHWGQGWNSASMMIKPK
jgi:hypothetical protein